MQKIRSCRTLQLHLIYPGELFSCVGICSRVYKTRHELEMSGVGEKFVQGRVIGKKFVDLGLGIGGE